MRVRGDEIQPGDTYVFIDGTAVVASIERIKGTSRGGATVTWIRVTFEDGTTAPCAPHSKHTIRRPRTTA